MNTINNVAVVEGKSVVALDGSVGVSAIAAATLTIERMTWLRMSASFVLIFRLMDSSASKHSSCKKIHICIVGVVHGY